MLTSLKDVKMTKKEEKKEETTSEEETSKKTAEESKGSEEGKSEDGASEDKKEEESGEENIDYKAELKKLQDVVAGDSYKYRQNKREEADDEEDDDKPITAKQLKEVLSDNTAQTVQTIKKEQIEAEVHKRARNDDEAALVLHHLTTTLKGGSGNTSADIDNAFAIANKGRVKEVVSEVSRAMQSSKRKSQADVQSRKTSEEDKDKAPTLSAKDQSMVERYKLVWYAKENKHVSQVEAKKLGLIK